MSESWVFASGPFAPSLWSEKKWPLPSAIVEFPNLALNFYPEGQKIQTEEARILFRAKNDENLGLQEKQKSFWD